MPRLIQVIVSEIPRGSGEPFDPHRTVIQHHSMEGDLLAESDPCAPERDYLIVGDVFTRHGRRWHRGSGIGDPVLVFDGDKLVPEQEFVKDGAPSRNGK